MTNEKLLQFLKDYIQNQLIEELHLIDEEEHFYPIQGIMYLSFGNWGTTPQPNTALTKTSFEFSTANGRLDIIIDGTQPNKIHSNRFLLKIEKLTVNFLNEENEFQIKEDLNWADYISFQRATAY